LYLGFFASSSVLGGLALAGWWHVSTTVGIVIGAVACVILALVGYDLIHRYQRWMTVVFAAAFGYLIVRMLVRHGVGHLQARPFAWGPFLAVLAIVATWQITYSVSMSDYSRYLPEDARASRTFWYTYAGTVIATVAMMLLGCLGAVLAANAFQANPVAYLAGQAGGGLAWLFYLVILLGVIAANVINVYGSMLCVTSSINALARFPITQRIRTAFILIATAVGTAIAIWGQGHFLTNYSNFLTFLLVLILPWTAVNLTDFYVVQHGAYDIDGLLEPNGSYPFFGWRGLVAYAIGVGVQIPFVNDSFYQGPISVSLGGADISWLVGLAVASLCYYLFVRMLPQQASLPKRAADAELERRPEWNRDADTSR
jgi:NCS1 family nucleobase:cation symporter-1